MPDVAALSGFIERSAALAGETLEVEDTGQVEESSIFEPEPEKHREAGRPPITEQFFNFTLLRQPAVSADREQIKQPPQPRRRHRSTHYEQLVYPLKPEARLAGAPVEFDPRHASIPEVGSRHDASHSTNIPKP
jgi:hypothetical protein